MKNHLLRGIAPLPALTTAALILAGCAVGPDFKRPDAPGVGQYTPGTPLAQTASADVSGGAAQTIRNGRDIPGDWWRVFRSDTLNRLVAEALKANLDIQSAQAALRQAQENVAAGQGGLFPTVSASGSGTREQSNTTVSTATGGSRTVTSVYNLYNASVDVSYDLDVFGGTRRNIESLQATADYQRFQLEASTLTIASNVVTAAIQEASLRAQIAATEEIIRTERAYLAILQQQFALGGVSQADVAAQQATVAQDEALLPPLQKQLAQQRNQLAVYLGRFPSEISGDDFELTSLTLPADLPLSLPSKLVEQRPDIRSSEAQLHAASAKIGVAVANMLPQITLSASYGSGANSFGDLFSPGTVAWNLAGKIVQTIFDGGTLLHDKRAAEAGFDQAAAQYRGTVLSAFQDVADALHAIQYDADTLKAQLAAERAAQRSLDIARSQYQAGATTYTTVLTAQTNLLNARLSRIQAQAARLSDTAALYQALGGGWWNRTDVVAAKFQPTPSLPD
ncbi:efflux transporter outer membrane subunit [Inquilinus limosus]|uniref:efflux transporter outer membrane subunit n=1 Tax=Inquilinus limosus TaxID=171674 RepID=UPI0003FBA94E|nr:efflux transporter outer membrane subunit [Inquilinus limosus]